MSGVASAVIGSAVIGGATSIIGSNKAAKASQHAADASVAEQQRQFDLVRGDTQGLRDLGDSAIGSINKLYGYAPKGANQPLSYEDWLKQNPSRADPIAAGYGGFGQFAPAFGGMAQNANSRLTYDQYVKDFKPPAASGPDMSGFFTSPDYQFRLDQGQRAIDSSLAARGGVLSGRAVKAGVNYASNLASGEYGSYVDRLLQQAGLGNTGIGASASAGANAANNISAAYTNSGAARGSAYLAGAQGVNNAVQGGLSNYMLSQYLGRPPLAMS